MTGPVFSVAGRLEAARKFLAGARSEGSEKRVLAWEERVAELEAMIPADDLGEVGRGGARKDAEGAPITLHELCRTEPAWATNRILTMEAELEKVIGERDASHEMIIGLCETAARQMERRESLKTELVEARDLAETYWDDSHHGLCGDPDPLPWKPAPNDELATADGPPEPTT